MESENIIRSEFQNLYNEVKEIHKEVTELSGKFIALQAHIVTQEIAVKTALDLKEKQIAESQLAKESLQRKHFAIIAILVSVISIVVGVVFKIAM